VVKLEFDKSDLNVLHHCELVSKVDTTAEENKEFNLLIDREDRITYSKIHSAGHILDMALNKTSFKGKLDAGKGYHFPDGPWNEYTYKEKEFNKDLFSKEVNEQLKLLFEHN